MIYFKFYNFKKVWCHHVSTKFTRVLKVVKRENMFSKSKNHLVYKSYASQTFITYNFIF